jgi:transcriptional antiterminator RfaH
MILAEAKNERCWFVAATQAGKEDLASRHLRNQGFRVFAPRRPRTVRHARRVLTLLGPLFPGYIFVSFDRSAAAWRSINGTIGVRHLIAAGDSPVPLPREFVTGLAALADADGVVSFASELKVGGSVRLMSGPFAERIGELESLDSKGRVRVMLDLLSSKVPLGSTTSFRSEPRLRRLIPVFVISAGAIHPAVR